MRSASADPATGGDSLTGSQTGADLQPGRPPIFGRLVWLTLFRLLLVTVLLGGVAVIGWREGQEGGDVRSSVYAVILATYGGALAVAVLLWRTGPLRAAAAAHLLFGAALAAGLTALTGGSESVFLFMFLLAIVDGAILLHRWGAALALGLALVGYGAALGWNGALRWVPATTLWVHAAAFAATALLAGWLSEQLRTTGERLAASESDLADVTALHEEIVQSVTSGLLTLDGAGRITFLNRAGELLTGLGDGAVRGQPVAQLFPGFVDDSRRGETEWTGPDGQRRMLGFTTFALSGARGGTRGQAVIFQDLTGLRAMEEKVRRSERFADLGRVAAGLAHELRNPLASMSGCVELLQAAPGLRPEEGRLLGIVLKEAGRLDQLVTRFLAYSRPTAPQPAPTDVAQVAGEVAEALARDPAAARVRFERELEAAVIDCDPDQLRQVLWNLLLNAVQALGAEGGTVRLTTAPDGSGARLTVADDGPGIAAEDLDRLFAPFFSRKPGGTGLGLATVHRIVEAHGGEVRVEPVAPRGARFVVRLPPRPAVAEAAPSGPPTG
jgi:two-component system sensor histidine kinase PilS (NtrC family)